tara:strand:+ start:580 stop:900 length:321 start_codon:yes stop_codon:yes gene_type:complete
MMLSNRGWLDFWRVWFALPSFFYAWNYGIIITEMKMSKYVDDVENGITNGMHVEEGNRAVRIEVYQDEIDERSSDEYDPYEYISAIDEEQCFSHKGHLDFIWREGE